MKSDKCKFCNGIKSLFNRHEKCYEVQITAVKARLEEAEGLLNWVKLMSIVEEWPDCGKPYWCCEICGASTDKGQDVSELVHNKRCPIPEIKAFLITTASADAPTGEDMMMVRRDMAGRALGAMREYSKHHDWPEYSEPIAHFKSALEPLP